MFHTSIFYKYIHLGQSTAAHANSTVVGLGRAWIQPEARSEGVFGDLNPSLTFFGGLEGDPRLTERTRGQTRGGPDRQIHII